MGQMKQGRPDSVFALRQQLADQNHAAKVAQSERAALRRQVLAETAERLKKLSEDGPLPMGAALGIAEAIAWIEHWAKE